MSNQSQNIEITETVLMAYLTSELTDQQRISVDQWINASQDNTKAFNQVKKTWELTANIEPKPISVNTEAAWKEVQLKIDSDKIISHPNKHISITKTLIGIAAAVAIIVMATVFWKQPISNIELMASDTVIEKTLADGSEITLNKNSQVTFPKNFGAKERRISLKGEAFFDIARDTSIPFIIDMPNNFYVKVLGTSFSINTGLETGETTVFVTSGTVEFGNSEDKLVLTANEKATYQPATKTFKKISEGTSVNQEIYWINEQLIFEGEQLADIIHVLNDVFKTDIQLLCHKASNYPIISNHQHEDLEEILEVICTVHNLKLSKETVNGKDSFSISCND